MFKFRYNAVDVGLKMALLQRLHEGFGEAYVGEGCGGGEEGGDVAVGEAGDAAADAGDVEEELRVLAGEGDEVIHVGLDGLNAALHRRDGVALALEADAAAEDCAEMLERGPGGAATVHPRKIASENEDLISLQGRNVTRSEVRALNVVVFSHNVQI